MNNQKCFIPKLQKGARNNYKQTFYVAFRVNPIPALRCLWFRQEGEREILVSSSHSLKGTHAEVAGAFGFPVPSSLAGGVLSTSQAPRGASDFAGVWLITGQTK